MKNPKHPLHSPAFTLLEIMIVVVILGLLASIAVPAAMRARHRSQATAILNDARQLDAAKSQYGLENGKESTVVPVFADLTPYLKDSTKLATSGGSDTVGNAFVIGNLQTSIQVSPTTQNALSSATGGSFFWGPYS